MSGAENSFDGWNDFPEELLEKVFSFLSLKERESARFVCPKWEHMFAAPSLWHHMKYYALEGTIGANDEKILNYVNRFGCYMKTLEIGLGRHNRHKPQNLNEFFEILNQNPPQLEELVFGMFSCYIYGRPYDDPQFFECVANFLKSQKRLKVLKFAKSRLMVEDSLKMLEAAAVFGKNSIETLDLEEQSDDIDLNQEDTARLIEIISSFEKLKHLVIKYPSMDILRGIAEQIAPKLELLEISFCNELDFPPLSSDEWLYLKRVFRNIRVSQYVTLCEGDIAVNVPFSELLPPVMPLKELEIYFGEDLASAKRLYDYVADMFKNSLDSLTLWTGFHGVIDDREVAEVIAFIQKLPKLKKFVMKGDVPNNLVQFLDKLCVKKSINAENIVTWKMEPLIGAK